MYLDEVKRQFVEQVKLRAYDDKYIDKNEEREILQIAMPAGRHRRFGPRRPGPGLRGPGLRPGEQGRCPTIKELIETFANNDGKIDEKEFNDAVTTLQEATARARRTTSSASGWSSRSSRTTATRSSRACSTTGSPAPSARWAWRDRQGTPPPGPLPEAERGRKKSEGRARQPLAPVLAPPLRFGEGVGGGVASPPWSRAHSPLPGRFSPSAIRRGAESGPVLLPVVFRPSSFSLEQFA